MCTCISKQPSQRGRTRAGPSLHSWLGVPLGSIVVSQGEPFALSLHLVFCGMQPILAGVQHESAVWWCAPGSAGSWSSCLIVRDPLDLLRGVLRR